MQTISPALIGLIAAIASGLLVGMERGWAQREMGKGHRVAGFRTFGLIGLAGGLAGLLSDPLAVMMGLGIAAPLALGYALTAREDAQSATTTIAGVLTFGIGLVAVRIAPHVALAAAAGTFALLSARHSMHALLKGMSEAEIDGVARFLLVALVVLPLLPDAAYGPYEAWNPRRIWMVVVIVAGFSFAGYVAARRFGSERGILIMALTGALVSSTAVTADYARRLKSEPESRGALTAGIALASIVMFVRVQALTLLLVPRALPTLALTMAPATLVAALLALLAWRREASAGSAPVRLGNPFAFKPALLLAAMVAFFSLIVRWALDRFGDQGMALLLGLTGLVDVDAAVVTLAGMPSHVLDHELSGLVLATPVLANTAFKAGITIVMGGARHGLRASMPLLLSLLASALGLAIIYVA